MPFTTIATRVAVIPVARDADPSDRSGTVVPDPKTGALQGTSVTIKESLTPEKMAPRALPAPKGARPAATPAAEPPDPEALRRYYMAVPFSARGVAGPPSKIVDVPMTSVPDKVAAVRASMKGRNVALNGSLRAGCSASCWIARCRSNHRRSTIGRPRRLRAATLPIATGPTLYNVYRDIAPDPLALPGRVAPESPWAAVPAAACQRAAAGRADLFGRGAVRRASALLSRARGARFGCAARRERTVGTGVHRSC